MHSESMLWGTTPRSPGLSGSSPAVGTRHPTLPRGARWWLAYGGSPRVDPFITHTGFTESGRLAAPIFAFRGLNRGFTHVTARSFAPRGFAAPIARTRRPRCYMCHRQFTWWAPFSSQDRVRLP